MTFPYIPSCFLISKHPTPHRSGGVRAKIRSRDGRPSMARRMAGTARGDRAATAPVGYR